MRNVFRFFVIVVLAAAPALAQAPPKPAHMIINNAPPGANIDVFIDSGKVQTVPFNQQGSAAFDLDFLSLGKPRGQLYVETCKDGQRVRIVSDGTTVPEEEGCNRKPVGGFFKFACTRKITLDLSALDADFGGCGSILTSKEVLIPGTVLVGGMITRYVRSGPALPPYAVTPTPPVAQQPSQPAPPPTAPTVPTQPTQPTPPPTLDLTGTYDVGVCTVVFDPASHEAVLRLCALVRQILASASNGGVTFRADAPWVTIGGTYNTQSGEFSLSSSGAVAGFSNVGVTLRGNVTSSGQFFGELEIGSNGMLPGGQPVRYQIRAQRR